MRVLEVRPKKPFGGHMKKPRAQTGHASQRLFAKVLIRQERVVR